MDSNSILSIYAEAVVPFIPIEIYTLCLVSSVNSTESFPPA